MPARKASKKKAAPLKKKKVAKAAPKKKVAQAKAKAAPKKKAAPSKKAVAPKKAAAPKKPAARVETAVPNTVSIDGYVNSLPSPLQMIVQRLRQLVRDAAPEAVETFRWAQPVYEANGPFAYVRADTNAVNFGFWRGALLEDSHGVLEGGADDTRQVTLSSLDDIKTDILRTLVRQAVLLNTRPS